MATRREPTVVDLDGNAGRLGDVRVREGDEAIAVVRLEDGARVEVPFAALEHHDDGGYSIAARWRDFAGGTEHSLSIPVIAERVVTSVREAPERRVRVKRRVVTESQLVETPIWRERIDIERVPVNAYVAHRPEPRQEGDTLIVPCVEEVVVVETRLRVREELRIKIVRERHVDQQTVVLRRHEIDIESAEQPPASKKPRKQGETP